MPKVGTRSKTLLNDKIKNRVKPSVVWRGPSSDGITQSLLSMYIKNKEHFRIRVMEGLREKQEFNSTIEFGQMFHLCDEHYSAGSDWTSPLKRYTQELCREYKQTVNEIRKWWNVTKVLFPIYCEHWQDDDFEKAKTPLIQEEVFKHPYKLPSGRYITLRGKIDGANITGKKSLWMHETKTKGEINKQKIQNQLYFDLQCNMYGLVLSDMFPDLDFSGVSYNCVRRPLSGGKGNIRRHKATKNKPEETWDHYYERLSVIIQENKKEYFQRFQIPYTRKRLEIFKDRCLNPILENLFDDYEWWKFCVEENEDHFCLGTRERKFPKHISRHFLTPVGLYNRTALGFLTPYDEYLRNGSLIGLEKVQTLFGELQ